jgi:hypothetical protein
MVGDDDAHLHPAHVLMVMTSTLPVTVTLQRRCKARLLTPRWQPACRSDAAGPLPTLPNPAPIFDAMEKHYVHDMFDIDCVLIS